MRPMATHRCGGIANDGRGWLGELFDGEKKKVRSVSDEEF